MTPRESSLVPPQDDESSCSSTASSSSTSSPSDEDENDDGDVRRGRRRSKGALAVPRRQTIRSPAAVCSSLLLSVLPPPSQPLGLIFDLDGTLVAEPLDDDDSCSTNRCSAYHSDESFLRPGVREFLQWCRSRGHAVAIWTAAQSAWAHYVGWKLSSGSSSSSGSTSSTSDFAFVWDATKLRRRRRIPADAHGLDPSAPARGSCDGGSGGGGCCLWCGPYRWECDRCACGTEGVYKCPCRSTKDLRKVWRNSALRRFGFQPHRTLLIENTPQQCLNNYGNAVYVPTYRGTGDPSDAGGEGVAVLVKLQRLLVQLERSPDVRRASKCCCASHAASSGRRPHACYEQSWWTAAAAERTGASETGVPEAGVPPADAI